MMNPVEQFSAGYYLLNAHLLTHSGDSVIMPHDLYDEISRYVTEPLLRIGDSHYWPRPERTVPASTVAVPDFVVDQPVEAVLVARDETAFRLIDRGEQKRPT